MTPDEPEECFLPATGIYGPQRELPARVLSAVHAYSKLVLQRINSNWRQNMPRAAKDPWYSRAVVTVRFAILPDGSVDPPRVTASSGRDSYDHHALEAIRQANPFDPLPLDDNQPLRFCVKFGYHVDSNEFIPKQDPLPYAKPSSPSPSSPSRSNELAAMRPASTRESFAARMGSQASLDPLLKPLIQNAK